MHKLRPVETYRLDEKGEPIFDPEHPVRSAQVWQLNKNASGAAEMSAYVEELLNLPEGDVVIDPSMSFTGTGVTIDYQLDEGSPNSNIGTGDLNVDRLYYPPNPSYLRNTIIGFNLKNAGINIDSAVLQLYQYYHYNTNSIRIHCLDRKWNPASVSWNNDGFGFNWNGGTFNNNKYVELPISSLNGYVSVDITSLLRSHYYKNPMDVLEKGFLIRKGDSYTGGCRYYSSETGSVSQKPKLIIGFTSTQFGAHIGTCFNVPQTLNSRADKVSDDYMKIIRVYGSEPNDPWPPADEVINISNDSSNLKAIVVYGGGRNDDVYPNKKEWWNWDQGPGYNQDYTPSLPVDFGEYVLFRLLRIHYELTTNANHIYRGVKGLKDVVSAVEIENEEIGLWGNVDNAGANFAEYYVAALKAIRSSDITKDLEVISGGSVNQHQMFAHSDSAETKFTSGFIATVIEIATLEGKDSLTYLPQTMAIHGYSGNFSPENIAETEEFLRLQQINDICASYNYFPNYAITEFGHSAIDSVSLTSQNPPYVYFNPYAPFTGTGETSQAVHYFRDTLINMTMRLNGGQGWKYCIYYDHPRTPVENIIELNPSVPFQKVINDWGFFHPGVYPTWAGYPGANRAIRELAQKILNPSAIDYRIRLAHPEITVWQSLQRVSPLYGNDGYAWCGWKNNLGEYWGAIWRYRHSTDYYRTPSGSDSRTFVAKEKDLTTLNPVIFRYSLNTGSAVINSVTGTVTKQKIGDDTHFAIPNVSENPILIKFN